VLLLGFDPGGFGAFGWAVLTSSQDGLCLVNGGICSSARDAIVCAKEVVAEPPTAIGVDAPLFWSQAGDRRADAHIRARVCRAGGRSGTVGHVNSLFGACLVGGVVVAKLARELWPAAQITESHPKALIRLSSEARTFANDPGLQGPGHHVRDAALGAYAAHALATNAAGWRDLVAIEPEPLFPFGERVAYWFPEP
jgi:hypothetical protein